MPTLQDRIVLVIGRGDGIGGAVVLAARAAGAKVVVAGREPAPLKAAYPDLTVETVDVSDEASIASLAVRLGTVDHVVSTVSARARGPVGELYADAVTLSFRTKVVGAIMLAKHLAPIMPSDGSFVLFSGASGRKSAPGSLAVGTTNGAVDTLTRALAVELAPIRVNAIAPGTVDTGAYDGLGEERKTALLTHRAEHSPAGRIGTSDDIAEAVVFALANTYLTGVSLNVDGGEPLV
ncbi:MAG TPA: SDR family oxidoreductase [Jatrophihabitantaceae bacterium]|jgi:NAD(P)-dependent dehydrogenase (short-subunit alcohol dehydrogenase family)